MTVLQKVFKSIYPFSKAVAPKKILVPQVEAVSSRESFYDLEATMIDGRWYDFAKLRDKRVLIVNTASNCAFSPQYAELEQLNKLYNDDLVLLAFPSNDFFNQEKGDDNEIKAFCIDNYGITFPLIRKSVVVKKDGQNKVFKWLTDSKKNGWNDKPPAWNFSKYLIDGHGQLVNCFSPAISPLSVEVRTAIESCYGNNWHYNI